MLKECTLQGFTCCSYKGCMCMHCFFWCFGHCLRCEHIYQDNGNFSTFYFIPKELKIQSPLTRDAGLNHECLLLQLPVPPKG
jgi:hypothetical protein